MLTSDVHGQEGRLGVGNVHIVEERCVADQVVGRKEQLVPQLYMGGTGCVDGARPVCAIGTVAQESHGTQVTAKDIIDQEDVDRGLIVQKLSEDDIDILVDNGMRG